MEFEPAALAAFLSAVAAGASAIAAWRGPISAARMAESLRSASEVANDQRRFKLNVFASVMQERAELYSNEGVRSLNSIDIAFYDSPKVREAWSELYQAFQRSESNPIPAHVQDERLRKLLREMSLDLGFSESLRIDDFSRVYLPNALLDEKQVRRLKTSAALAQLTNSNNAANNELEFPDLAARWPPKPE